MKGKKTPYDDAKFNGTLQEKEREDREMWTFCEVTLTILRNAVNNHKALPPVENGEKPTVRTDKKPSVKTGEKASFETIDKEYKLSPYSFYSQMLNYFKNPGF